MVDDMKAKVKKRAAKIKAKAQEGGKRPDSKPAEKTKPDKSYVLDCLSRNKIGDAALFNTLHKGKYLYVSEWKEWLYWTDIHKQMQVAGDTASQAGVAPLPGTMKKTRPCFFSCYYQVQENPKQQCQWR